MIFTLFFGAWFFCLVLGTAIGWSTGRMPLGFLLSFIFGPFGVIAIFFIPEKGVKCPKCKENIKTDALICKHCKTEIKPQLPQTKQDLILSDIIIPEKPAQDLSKIPVEDIVFTRDEAQIISNSSNRSGEILVMHTISRVIKHINSTDFKDDSGWIILKK